MRLRAEAPRARALLDHSRFICIVLWLGLLYAPLAHAQFEQMGANGFKIGDARVHPFLEMETRYDSAAGFFSPANHAPIGTLRPELIGHLRPGFRAELPSEIMALQFSGNLDYVRYLGILNPGAKEPSRLDAAVDLNLGFNKNGSASFNVSDHLARSDRTSNLAVTVGIVSLFNELKVDAPIRPGAGALEIIPKAAFAVESFQPVLQSSTPTCADPACDPALVRTMSYVNWRLGTEAKWKFFPKTALVLESSFDARTYPNAANNPRARLFKSTAGLTGLVTSRIATVVKLGWGHDFGATHHSALLANVEATYFLRDPSNLKLGYLRSLDPVPGYGTFTDDRFYLEARYLFQHHLFFRLAGTYDHIGFNFVPSALPTGFGAGRSDNAFGLELGPDYQAWSWAIVSLGYRLTVHSSSVESTALARASSANYSRHEVFLRLNFSY